MIVYVTGAGKEAVKAAAAAATPAVDPHVDELHHAMDTDAAARVIVRSTRYSSCPSTLGE